MAVARGAREQWSSRLAFLLAAIGSAVGLGNLWRFPAEAGENGGGAFVVFYIFCVALIALPVLLTETLIGRHGQASAPESTRKLALESGASRHWSLVAMIGVSAAFLVLGFYCLVGGWVLYYIGLFARDLFASGLAGGAFAGRDPEEISALLPAMFGDGWLMSGLDILFLAITVGFVARGVSKGIEFVASWMMPAFFVLLVAITVYGAFTGAFREALDYLFVFEWDKLTAPVMLAGVGQAFFSLGVGASVMVTYGTYVGREVNIAGTSAIVAAADTAVALVAGLCIFPIVFAAGLAPDGGPGLMFQSLPLGFQAMPGGALVGLLFFVMVGFAALTSSVSILEAPVAWMMERFRMRRGAAVAIVGLGALASGVLSAFSFNQLADFHPLGFIPLFEGQGVFDTLDTMTGKLLMPLGGILFSLFLGWHADQRIVAAESGLSAPLLAVFRFLVRWLCPLVLSAILVAGIFPDILA